MTKTRNNHYVPQWYQEAVFDAGIVPLARWRYPGQRCQLLLMCSSEHHLASAPMALCAETLKLAANRAKQPPSILASVTLSILGPSTANAAEVEEFQ